MTKIFKWGIIGCGNVTEVKSGPAYKMAEGFELVAAIANPAIFGVLASMFLEKKEQDQAKKDKSSVVVLNLVIGVHLVRTIA